MLLCRNLRTSKHKSRRLTLLPLAKAEGSPIIFLDISVKAEDDMDVGLKSATRPCFLQQFSVWKQSMLRGRETTREPGSFSRSEMVS